ncbi:unnamed protein product [Protopolystoma xenopodis]|uniref:Uncharacterized protein n=1 Tax=Protopolystoma xenopodis TaxID=117903 RepID=A0A3S5B6Q2_9PLAT|nr:unnamed protein product [Protopolystoma xenopodis]
MPDGSKTLCSPSEPARHNARFHEISKWALHPFTNSHRMNRPMRPGAPEVNLTVPQGARPSETSHSAAIFPSKLGKRVGEACNH